MNKEAINNLKEREGKGGFHRFHPIEPFENAADYFSNFSDLKFLSSSFGTNMGGIAYDSKTDETLYVKKYFDSAQASCEFVANRLYALMEVPVLRGVLIKSQDGFAYATPYNDRLKKLLPDKRKIITSYLLVAAYLKDYDIVGIGPENPFGNLMEDENGRVIIIDHGASLLFRGLTGRKSDSWTNEQNVETVDLMRDPNTQHGKFKRSADVFGDITDFDLVEQAANLINKITKTEIEIIINNSGLEKDDREKVEKILVQGLEYIKNRFLVENKI